ncbi:MAG: pyridoxal phosphate-dependent aminotransferase [Treponema sp.]|nr:pyridoxal phosphate-dependent aminotransferase [Treponema sp.]
MPIADAAKKALDSQQAIRRLFEEGARLKKQYGDSGVFDFSIGNPDIPPPPAFYEALRKIIAEGKKGAHGYMPNAGFPEAREALAKKISAEQGVRIGGGGVVMSCGAAGGLNVAFKAILNPGDEVIVSKPYFIEYVSYAANHGGLIVPVASLPDFDLDIDAIKAKLSPKTAAVLINSPNNPTGRVYPAQTIARLAAALADHGNACGRMPYLISDEPYREIVFDGVEAAPVLSAYEQAIVVSSYSKSLSLPGERIGYIAVLPQAPGGEDLIDALIYATRVLGFINAPALMQRAVAELVSSAADVQVYARRRALFTQALDRAGITYAKPEGTFFLFCKVPQGGSLPADDRAFAECLSRHRILGVPGSLFGMAGWVRFAYCADERAIEASGEAFRRAAEEWKEQGRGA